MSNSEAINPGDDFGVVDPLGDDLTQVGKISQESAQDVADDSSKGSNQSFLKRLFGDINLFDALLLVSLVLITFSTLYLVYAMVYHYQGWPWNRPWDVEL